MKFVATKTTEQLDLQALHRVRERLVGQRTGVVNQIRAFLLERGVAVRQGLRFLRTELPIILAKRTDVLSPRMMRIIEDLTGDWHRLRSRSPRASQRPRPLRPLLFQRFATCRLTNGRGAEVSRCRHGPRTVIHRRYRRVEVP
jgi:transposase